MAFNFETFKGVFIISFILLFVMTFVSCILGINLYAAIDNNDNKDATTADDLSSRNGFFTFWIVTLVLIVLAIGAAIFWAWVHFNKEAADRLFAGKRGRQMMTSRQQQSQQRLLPVQRSQTTRVRSSTASPSTSPRVRSPAVSRSQSFSAR